jgi:hypothetical protein
MFSPSRYSQWHTPSVIRRYYPLYCAPIGVASCRRRTYLLPLVAADDLPDIHEDPRIGITQLDVATSS